jgi:hypothetical protein
VFQGGGKEGHAEVMRFSTKEGCCSGPSSNRSWCHSLRTTYPIAFKAALSCACTLSSDETDGIEYRATPPPALTTHAQHASVATTVPATLPIVWFFSAEKTYNCGSLRRPLKVDCEEEYELNPR